MTFLKNLLAGASALGIFAIVAVAQAPRPEVVVPPPSQLPPQSPAAPTSAGAVVIQYKVDILDKDGDRKVSRAEAAGVPDLLKIFDKLDLNRDGKLDESELAEHNKRALGAK
jgi:hypothetical protein